MEPLLCCGFIQFLLRFDPRFYLFDHGVEFLLTLLVGLGVDVVGFAPALGVGGRIASLVEVIVQLVDTAGSRSAVFSFVGLERFRSLPLFGLGELCFMLFERVARADTALDLLCRFLLHLARDVAVGVECGRDRGMADDHRHRFDVHAVLESVGSEGVSEIMEAHACDACVLHHVDNLFAERFRIARFRAVTRRGKDPRRVGLFFQLPHDLEDIIGQVNRPLALLRLE